MGTDYIDFISAYCDRWCERCAFTTRCSAYAVEVAIAMCGDVREGLELAVGAPHPAEPDAKVPGSPEWLADFDNSEPTPEEIGEFERREHERRARIEASAISPAARAYAILAHHWLSAERERLEQIADAVLRDAVQVVSWDHVLIGAKLNRALRGRDQRQHDGDFGDHDPVQNDWNGSAKVALISIERSEAAWQLIAACTSGETPSMMADHLAQLRVEVEQEFPDARRFVRPGFDDRLPARP